MPNTQNGYRLFSFCSGYLGIYQTRIIAIGEDMVYTNIRKGVDIRRSSFTKWSNTITSVSLILYSRSISLKKPSVPAARTKSLSVSIGLFHKAAIFVCFDQVVTTSQRYGERKSLRFVALKIKINVKLIVDGQWSRRVLN